MGMTRRRKSSGLEAWEAANQFAKPLNLKVQNQELFAVKRGGLMEEIRDAADLHGFASRFLVQHQPVRLCAEAMTWFAPVAHRWQSYNYLKAKVGEAVHVDVACTSIHPLSGGMGLDAEVGANRPSSKRCKREEARPTVSTTTGQKIPERAVFSGDENCRQDVQLEFGSLCDLALAAEAGTKHFAMALGLEYYLCQCPILSTDSEYPSYLPTLAAEFTLPPFLPSPIAPSSTAPTPSPDLPSTDLCKLHSVNLWLGVNATRSNIHYDANHGLLCVVRGQKRVRLYSPAAHQKLHPRSVVGASMNHSTLMPSTNEDQDENFDMCSAEEHSGGTTGKGLVVAASNAVAATPPPPPPAASPPPPPAAAAPPPHYAPPPTFVVEVGPGEGLLIPEGWWHQVRVVYRWYDGATVR
jgi:hypothetical protein